MDNLERKFDVVANNLDDPEQYFTADKLDTISSKMDAEICRIDRDIKRIQYHLHDTEMKAKSVYYLIYPPDENLKDMKTKIEICGFTLYSRYKFGWFRKFILKHIFRAKVESLENGKVVL